MSYVVRILLSSNALLCSYLWYPTLFLSCWVLMCFFVRILLNASVLLLFVSVMSFVVRILLDASVLLCSYLWCPSLFVSCWMLMCSFVHMCDVLRCSYLVGYYCAPLFMSVMSYVFRILLDVNVFLCSYLWCPSLFVSCWTLMCFFCIWDVLHILLHACVLM